MPAFTLGRLAKLYGMHRSSIYEAVAKGRVSAGLDGNGQRVIDLAEAIRVWGEPATSPTAKPDTRQAAPVAEQAYPTDALNPLIEELRLLREEVAGLRAELRLLEHRPQHPPAAEDQEKKPVQVRSFADLLDALSD
jgi:hypothetical protein